MNHPNFFDEELPFLNHPLLTPIRTSREVDFVVSELSLSAGARILDIGCGFGRHSIELARRGFIPVGIDPSVTMIAAARKNAADRGVQIDFRKARAETFIAEKDFDAAICLFTTLGQITAATDNHLLIARAFSALKPGGGLVVEVPQRAATIRELKSADRFGNGDRYTQVSRTFNSDDNSITEIFTVVSPQQTKIFKLHYHLFTKKTLADLIIHAGFTIQEMYGDYDRTPLLDEHQTMVVIARKLLNSG